VKNTSADSWVTERDRLQEVVNRLYDERAPLLRTPPQVVPNPSQSASPTRSRASMLADVERRINFAQLQLLTHVAKRSPQA
jgi:hypothetical protein